MKSTKVMLYRHCIESYKEGISLIQLLQLIFWWKLLTTLANQLTQPHNKHIATENIHEIANKKF